MNEQIAQSEEMRPCEGCGGMTKKNTIDVDCWECRGEGSVEDEEDFTGEPYWRKCWNCNGRTVIQIAAWYCGSRCYEIDNHEDF